MDDRDDPNSKKKEKSRRPANTAFRQQRLKAWQPILTPKTVLPLFFIIGVIFAPIGGLLLYASAQVQELVIDYTHCSDTATEEASDVPSKYWSASFKTALAESKQPTWKLLTDQKSNLTYNDDYKETVCQLNFTLPNDVAPPVLFYYRLTNFYQNHRRYVQSVVEDQLKGEALTKGALGDCDPLESEKDKPYYPCGLIANSMFNDTFSDVTWLNPTNNDEDNSKGKVYPLSNKGIAWSSDKDRYKKTKYTHSQVLPPPNWHDQYPDGYKDDDMLPKLHEDEAFMVWMRTAGLPVFSKLALRNDHDTMKEGDYMIKIYDRFPVREYSGTKSLVISTRTVMGGKNPFLGIAYVVVAGLCVLLGALFTARHLIKPRKLGDHTYLSWNNEETGVAQASGRDTH